MPRGPDTQAAILFDMDGTLVDSAPPMTRCLNRLAARYGTPPTNVTLVRKWISLGGEAMLRGVLGNRMGDPATTLEEFRDILRGDAADPADLFPGTVEMLAELKNAGHVLGVCTNKREDIAIPYATGLGLAPYFAAIVGGAAGRKLKPDPFVADLLLERLGMSRRNAIFVGDSEVDAETAAAAGIPFILVTFGYPSGELHSIAAAARIDGFATLPALIEAIAGKQSH